MIHIACDILIKRPHIYRSYVTLSEDIADEKIIEELKRQIVKLQDDAICELEECDIGEDDIVSIEVRRDLKFIHD